MTEISNQLQQLRDAKKLNSMIDAYEQKLDNKVNQAIHHMMNYSYKINDFALPQIQKKRIPTPSKLYYSFQQPKASFRSKSIGAKSFLQRNSYVANDTSQVDTLLDTYKHKTMRRQVAGSSQLQARPIGSQKYVKPKFTRKKPQVLPKEMRLNPFYQKNAIKANELNKGMFTLLQMGKVGKNIDISTAFQKGRPVLQAHQAIVHQAEQKYAYVQMHSNKQQIRQKIPKNPQDSQGKLFYQSNNTSNVQMNNEMNWAITMPAETYNDQSAQFDSSFKTKKNTFQDFQDPYMLQFMHYKITKNLAFRQIKNKKVYCQNLPQILMLIKVIQKQLREYNLDLAYCNSKKLLNLAIRYQCLNKPQKKQIYSCLVLKDQRLSKENINSLIPLDRIVNKGIQEQKAISIIQAQTRKYNIRKIYLVALRRQKMFRRMGLWLRNGSLIKKYREQLKLHEERIKTKFDEQQKQFRINYPSIQASKHYQIHIPNRQFMQGFKWRKQINNSQITRIFNLQNPNTHIIYICPEEISIDAINYYFKIMELQEIQGYYDRVTFIQLSGPQNKVNLPKRLNTSAKLYYNSKALRKIKKKINQNPAYIVSSETSQTDMRLSVFLGLPVYSGNFMNINCQRSLLQEGQFYTQELPVFDSLRIAPKSLNTLGLSNLLIRHCQNNKSTNKYILKINGKHSSSGLALLTYPFNSLPEMYSNTALVQPYYYRSIQKYYSDFIRKGGVIQMYQQGLKTITVGAKILHDNSHIITGTFQRISSGFVNVGYNFPQRYVHHKQIIDKCKKLLEKLVDAGHFGNVEITIFINNSDELFLSELQLYSTRISNSLGYFKFLAGGYFSNMGEFMTKITNEEDPDDDEQIATMQSRGYCYIPFILHFGLSEKQANSFFQLCRIGGVSFDLQNKFGSTFILLGSLQDCVGVITSSKEKKTALKLMIKTIQFLFKQNSHNISNQMLQQKENRMKQRLNILAIKERIETL